MAATLAPSEIRAFLNGAVDEFLSAIQSEDSAAVDAFEARFAFITDSARDLGDSLNVLAASVTSRIHDISERLIEMNLASLSLEDTVEGTVSAQLNTLPLTPPSENPHVAAHQWLLANLWYPYPTQRELRELAKQSGLSVSTLKSWFSQARTQIGWSGLRMTRYGGSKTKICEAAAIYAEQSCPTSTYDLDFLKIEHAAQKMLSPEEEKQSKLLDFFEDCVLPMDPSLVTRVKAEKTQLKIAEKTRLRRSLEPHQVQQSEPQLRTTHSGYHAPPGAELFDTPELSPERESFIDSDDLVDPDDLPTVSVLGRRSLEDDDDNGPTRKRSRTTLAPKTYSRSPISSRHRRSGQRRVSRQASPADTLVDAPSPAATLIGSPEPSSPLALEKDQLLAPISKKRRLSESDSHGFPKRHCIGMGITAGPRLQAVSSPHTYSKSPQQKILVHSITSAPSTSKTISFRFTGPSASHIPNIFTPAHFDLQKASQWNFSCPPSLCADFPVSVGNVAALDRKSQISDDALWAEADRKLTDFEEQGESDNEAVLSTPVSSWSTATSDDESEVITDVETSEETPRQENFPTVFPPVQTTPRRKRVARSQVTIVSAEPNIPETNSPVHSVSNEDNLTPAPVISKYPPPSRISPAFGPTSAKALLALS